MILVTCQCAFQLRWLSQNVGLGTAFFPVNSSLKTAFVRCPGEFRLRRLAQSVRPDLTEGLLHSLCEDVVEILVKCCQGLLHDLVQLLARSS